MVANQKEQSANKMTDSDHFLKSFMKKAFATHKGSGSSIQSMVFLQGQKNSIPCMALMTPLSDCSDRSNICNHNWDLSIHQAREFPLWF